MVVVEAEKDIVEGIVQLVDSLMELTAAKFLDYHQFQRLRKNDPALWGLLFACTGDRLTQTVELVKQDYSEDQLHAFAEGYPKFTRTGILVHYSQDSDKGLRGSGFHFHVQTNTRWQRMMTAARAAAAKGKVQWAGCVKSHAKNFNFELLTLAGTPRRRVRDADVQKHEAIARAAQNRHRTRKKIWQIVQEVCGLKDKEKCKNQARTTRRYINKHRPDLRWT